jgi:hypothetical protein
MHSRTVVARLAGALAIIACVPAAAHADWLFAAYGGAAHTQSSTVTLTVPDLRTDLVIDGVEYRGQSFQSPQYYGLRVAWIPDGRRWLGIEAEWIHAKVYAHTERSVQMHGTLRGAPIDAQLPLSSFVQRLAMSHGLNFILFNVAVRRELGPVDGQGRPRLAGVVRGGAGPMRPHAESDIDGVPRDQYEWGGLGAQAGAGLELSLGRGVGALGEYKLTWSSPEIDVAGGRATIPAVSHHLAFGVQYRF